ncbi:unnamed protein product [Phyllotreta striolata]|uniref:Uncharacterized protein n=1 Tax=Phyllotreta striolata TaxID=444603 RepID=A0A9N9TIB0_PHYSR|nr:unnamed protein product [Phyllotreta striolata]
MYKREGCLGVGTCHPGWTIIIGMMRKGISMKMNMMKLMKPKRIKIIFKVLGLPKKNLMDLTSKFKFLAKKCAVFITKFL